MTARRSTGRAAASDKGVAAPAASKTKEETVTSIEADSKTEIGTVTKRPVDEPQPGATGDDKVDAAAEKDAEEAGGPVPTIHDGAHVNAADVPAWDVRDNPAVTAEAGLYTGPDGVPVVEDAEAPIPSPVLVATTDPRLDALRLLAQGVPELPAGPTLTVTAAPQPNGKEVDWMGGSDAEPVKAIVSGTTVSMKSGDKDGPTLIAFQGDTIVAPKSVVDKFVRFNAAVIIKE